VEDKNLIESMEERCREIVNEAFPKEITHLRVKRVEINLEIDIISNKPQLSKDQIKNTLVDRLKTKLAAPIKLKINLL